MAEMAWLEAAVTRRQARRLAMRCALPSLSRPLYETIHTGESPNIHGVLSNETVRRSTRRHIFQVIHETGGRTAASAYSFFSELYLRAPYDSGVDHTIDDESAPIQAGWFYHLDNTPDVEVIRRGVALARDRAPDYLLVHPMGCDYVGHLFGGNSDAYRERARQIDRLLSSAIAEWLALGFDVIVTADHGMDDAGNHGGASDDETLIPYYAFGHDVVAAPDEVVSQLSVAPTILSLLERPIPRAMAEPSLARLPATTSRV